MPGTMRNRQAGYVGLVVILIALLIVAWLSKDALMKYGMLGGTTTTSKAAGQVATPGDVTTATPTPSNVMDKAKALEGMLQQESTRRGGAD